jgi:ATPase subunit of ABC transporter with duplicated ATPase domains
MTPAVPETAGRRVRSRHGASPSGGGASGAVLKATDLFRQRSGQVVLGGVSLALGPGERMGVVGPNGIGKTTLLRTLAGLEQPDSGTVEVSPPSAIVGYLAQSRQSPRDETVEQYLRDSCGIAEAEQAMGTALAAVAAGDLSLAAQEAYDRALARFNHVDPGGFEERAAAGLVALGAGPSLLGSSMGSLSGGELARAGLAALTLSRFDISLLDEPTNDLDFAGLEVLEKFVLGLGGGTVIVSHDRAFLARTVTSVLEIDPHTRKAALYRGGWTAYLEEKALTAGHRQEAYDKYRRSREELTERAQRERQWATSGTSRERSAPKDKDKLQRDFRINKTEQLAARARRTERALQRLEEVDKPWEPWQLRYTLAAAPRAGAVVVSLSEAVVQKGGFRLGPVDLLVEWGARVAVTGRNGSGKTTLVETVLGRAPLVSGTRSMGPSVVAGELAQHRAGLLSPDGAYAGPADKLLAAFLRLSGLGLAEARSLLAKFGLGAEHVDRPLVTLSPGERTRAQLACYQAVSVNFLVLDEPTNHLDLPAIEQLEMALDTYDGTLLIVSHDRRLLEDLRVTHQAEVQDGRVKLTAC